MLLLPMSNAKISIDLAIKVTEKDLTFFNVSFSYFN